MSRGSYGKPGVYNLVPITLGDGEGVALAVDELGRLILSSVAAGATDSGNPVKVGGVYNSTPPTLTTGQRGDLQFDANANTKTTLATGLNKTDDSVTNYPVGCNVTIVDLATDADVVVTASPAYLVAFRVDTVMSAHAAIIKDSATTMITIAASTAANYNENCHSATFATNITVESDNAATGKIAVFWRAV